MKVLGLKIFSGIELNPTTKEQFNRFRRHRRAWFSFLLLLGIYGLSLVSEFIAHSDPLLIRFEGKFYNPRKAESLPEDLFFGNGVFTEPDFHELAESDLFTEDTGNWMIWSLLKFGPDRNFKTHEVNVLRKVKVSRRRVQRVGAVYVDSNRKLDPDPSIKDLLPSSLTQWPPSVVTQINRRLENQNSPSISARDDSGGLVWSLAPYSAAEATPARVLVLVREAVPDEQRVDVIEWNRVQQDGLPEWWKGMPEDVQLNISEKLSITSNDYIAPVSYSDGEGALYELSFETNPISFPFRPIAGHPFGFDESGRDVFVIILYATRISLSFGFLLVVSSMVLGTLAGGLQGYIGGKFDLIWQRLIEIYSAIPFLYAMIFMGNIFGKSFMLLLIVYALFNWIGISYYMRAEFLKLRSQPFTEAARSLGLPSHRIMWKHILPNAVIPLITFFPFSLVGAIGSLSALDYLGFGLPVGTPSWGNLLSQAQTHPSSWWLILYSSLVLFIVILLGVFIGEGLRTAFDPKREAHWEA